MFYSLYLGFLGPVILFWKHWILQNYILSILTNHKTFKLHQSKEAKVLMLDKKNNKDFMKRMKFKYQKYILR